MSLEISEAKKSVITDLVDYGIQFYKTLQDRIIDNFSLKYSKKVIDEILKYTSFVFLRHSTG